MHATVIAPVLNERANVQALIESLASQTLPPAEIVIADGGSTDGTRELLESLASRVEGLRVIDGPGGRGENRNAAIAAAAYELIACIDAGCEAEADWLENIMKPLANGEDWVAGFYRPVGKTLRATCAGLALMSVLEEVEPGSFIPAGNSQGFRRSMWKQIGGFPENMVAAEDTLFGERALAAGYRPYFDGKAVVRWAPPSGLTEMIMKAYRWGGADAKAGLRAPIYKQVLVVYWGSVTAALVLAVLDWRLGVAALVPLAEVVRRRTRFKYRWASGAGKYLLIPVAHVGQLLSQSLGWFTTKLAMRLSQ